MRKPDGIRSISAMLGAIILIMIFAHVMQASETDFLPLSMEEIGNFAFPSVYTATDGRYLYNSVSYLDSLRIYDMQNPAVPVLAGQVKVDSLSRIFYHDQRLYVATWGASLHIFNVETPAQPQLISSRRTGGKVVDIIFSGQSAYILTENLLLGDGYFEFEIVNISNENAPVQTGHLLLNGAGEALAGDPQSGHLWLASYSSWSEARLQLIDISNPAAPTQVKIIYLNRRPEALWADDSLMIAAVEGSGKGTLMAWDVLAPADPVYLDSYDIPNEYGLGDMLMMDKIILVSGNETRTLYSFVWDKSQQCFVAGLTVPCDYPAQIIGWRENGASTYQKGISELTQATFYSVASEWSSGTRLIRIVKRTAAPGQVQLTLAITPQKAIEQNCQTSPPPGVYFFDPKLKTEVSISATPGIGWFFSEWIGPVPVGNPTKITMIGDAEVTAVFGPILTVSGRATRRVLCPYPANEEVQTAMPITISASLADDWTISSISISASGTGHDQNHIREVLLKSGGSVVTSGRFPGDNGTLTLDINPPYYLIAGQSVSYTVEYDFEFDPVTYARDKARSFGLKTQKVIARPVNYEPGEIAGAAKSDTLVIAPVYNGRQYGFATIGESIASTETNDDDSLCVCRGEYSGDYEVNKSLKIQSVEGVDRTVLIGSDNSERHAILQVKRENVTIKGFTFRTQTMGKAIGIRTDCYSPNEKLLIQDNIFEDGFYRHLSLESAVGTNIWRNRFGTANTQIDFDTGSDVLISENVWNGDQWFVKILNTKQSVINANRSTISGWLSLTHCRKSEVRGNGIPNAVLTSDDGIQNELTGNIAEEIRIEREQSSLISTNEVKQMGIGESGDLRILQNTIDGGLKFGIQLYGSRTEMRNRICANIIRNSFGPGIHLDHAKGCDIVGNTILSNGKFDKLHAGISCSSSSGIVIRDNTISNNRDKGITLEGSDILITGNRITQNRKDGIELTSGRHVQITNNSITDHNDTHSGIEMPTGLYIINSSDVYSQSNNLLRNCTGAQVISSTNVRLCDLNVSDSFCWFTGIHLENSSPLISGCKISANEGAGIWLTDGSLPQISDNIIEGNLGMGLLNENDDGTIDASGNWWGDSNGPGSGEVSENVIIGSWLSAAPNKRLSVDVDTLFLSAGKTDTVTAYYRDHDQLDGTIRIEIDDPGSWVQTASPVTLNLSDSTGAEIPLAIRIPDETAEGATQRVKLSFISESKAEAVADSFIVALYQPLYSSYTIDSDSATVEYGDSLELDIDLFDQYGERLALLANWTAESGAITDGWFKPDSQTGPVALTVEIPACGISMNSTVMVATDSIQLGSMRITPQLCEIEIGKTAVFIVKGLNQFGFPHPTALAWSGDGGRFENAGFFRADSVPGSYEISATDTLSAIQVKATVIVKERTVAVDPVVKSPEHYLLENNYPNPFNPSTSIRFQLPERNHVRMAIYNLRGELVRLLLDEERTPGKYTVIWDGCDALGQMSASGLYFIRMNSGNFQSVRKMMLLR